MRDKSTGTHRVLLCTAATNNVLRHNALFGGIRGEFLERDTTHFPRRGAARESLERRFVGRAERQRTHSSVLGAELVRHLFHLVLCARDQRARLRELHMPQRCLLYTSPSPRDKRQSRMPSSA